MGRLVLIRHGESAGNRDRVFTRTPEVPLTDAGRAQVLRAAERVAARYLPVAVVSSPFLRARQTAAILAERLALAVRVEEDLREQSYGELAGQPYAALRAASDYDPARY
ncbi:MAG: histidine phosphatase family protein, partial [Deltaproteobacteria bacterium]